MKTPVQNSLTFKSIVLSTSLLLALTTLSSCGKEKEAKSNPPTAQSVPPETPQGGSEVTPAPDNSLPEAEQAQTPDNSLPQTADPSNPGQDSENLPDLPASPQTPGGTLNGQNQDGRNGRGGTGRGQDQQNLPNGLGSQGDSSQSGRVDRPKLVKHEPQRAYQVNFSNQVAVKTGGQAEDLFYTSAGEDGVMEEFKLYSGKVSAQQQMMNSNLAKAILNAKLSRATSGGQVSLTLTVDEFGTMHTYKLVAGSDGDKMNLTLSKAGTTGEMEFQGGFVKCLDKSGGCDVAYAKLKFAGGYTRVIFRNVAADMHFLVQQNVLGNSAFSTMEKYIVNTVNNAQVANKIDSLKLSSFEVVNGRAGLGAMMTTLDRQVIGLNVPMVVSSMNSDVSATVVKSADLSKNFDLVNLTKSHSVELSRSIKQVHLVNNNGRGQFKIKMTFGSEVEPASIWLVAAGMQKQLISIEEIRSFESKLKVF